MTFWNELSLQELETHEGHDIALPSFDSDIAWLMGKHARKLALELHDKPVVIDITLSTGQVLFRTASRPGTGLDNDFWVNRKKKTALRFGKSSYYIGRKVALKGVSMEQALFVDPKEYACHGGLVPIRVLGSDVVVGALTVSGLAQDEDHALALRVLGDTKKQLSFEKK